MNKELIAKVKDGVAAVRNDGTIQQLNNVILSACPQDAPPSLICGDAQYYFVGDDGKEWKARYTWQNLPRRITEVHSVNEFFVEEEKPREVELRRTPEMSKRFRAACTVAQGLAAKNNWQDPSAIASMAYQIADELIKQENQQ